ncbi:MAG: response regulator [Leptolyngbya sp. PLA2]|nr:response regulator [Leptolyngbya sp.]MCE7971904.1 response regulator [Leptolyngbya sp. PL-A2]MCQ3939733.1 DNA-binding response regulator [cyanobacterium CYA1]MCZ7632020.1 response regulator [Phycisphaerales bacterium]MDL1903989.1 response regulator [Synechococcales cyanobacterium CNB]GIK18753.1 MAG: DNA-binding response regulator [Planctomycetota bacterium]
MQPNRHILIVEDERDLAELLAFNLRKAGYETTTAHDGRQALKALGERKPDLILLDLMLPELSGTEVAGRVRTNAATASIPIVMLTAKGEEVDQLVGLAVGADDYITKPFSTKVLLARIEAVLRRASGQAPVSSLLRAGPVEIDADAHRVSCRGQPIRLTVTEFRLLSTLVQSEGRVVSRAGLIRRAIGPGITVTPRTIDVHVTALRKKLGEDGAMIETVRGVGYRFSTEPEAAEPSAAGSGAERTG